MTQMFLAAMLAGFLALSPGPIYRLRNERVKRPKSEVHDRFNSETIIPTAASRVLVLAHPFEPNFVYIRVDDAVYALPLHTHQ